VEQEEYLLKLARYRPMLGLASVPPALITEWVLAQFAGIRATAHRRYAKFVQDGIGVPGPWDEVKGQVILGSEAFMARLTPSFRIAAQRRKFPSASAWSIVPRSRRSWQRRIQDRRATKQWHGPISSMGIHSPRSAGPSACTMPRSVASSRRRRRHHNTRCDPYYVDSCLTLQCTGPARKAAQASNFER
jgi:hypothetical protein